MTDLIIDTNVVFSALYDPDSVPGQIVELALEGTLTLYAPDTVEEELERILRNKLGYTDAEWEDTRAALPVEWIEQAVYERALEAAREAIADPGDVSIVATAITVDAAIVSGDGDLHPLEEPVVQTYRPRGTVEDLEEG